MTIPPALLAWALIILGLVVVVLASLLIVREQTIYKLRARVSMQRDTINERLYSYCEHVELEVDSAGQGVCLGCGASVHNRDATGVMYNG